MNFMGNRMHGLIGLWILAGLIVAGVNGTMLLSLLDEPLAGYSMQVRNADRSFRQYRLIAKMEAEKIDSGMELIANLFAPDAPEEKPVAVQPVSKPLATENKKLPSPVVLPTLTGIVTRLAADGTVQWLAMMDNGIWSNGDQFRELTIQRIDSRGIVLVRGDQSWFVKAPERSYSLAVH